jgi:hypothetical protein
MEILILSGNATHNRDYAYAMREVFMPLCNECYVHEYAHWDSDAPLIDIDRELHLLATEYQEHTDDNIVIFAKSVGIIVALRAIAEGVLHPQKCLFVGMPLRYIDSQHIDLTSLLAEVHIPLLFMQYEHDPEGSYESVRGLLSNVHAPQPFIIAKIAGQTHDYDRTEMLFNTLAAFIKQS